MPTRPPQVRTPTSGPRPARLNSHGSASPPEPDIWLAIITLGPKIAEAGMITSSPSRVARHHPPRPRAVGGGAGPHRDDGLRPGRAAEEAMHIVARTQVLAVDGEQDLARLDAHARLGEGGLELGVPVLAGEHARDAVA